MPVTDNALNTLPRFSDCAQGSVSSLGLLKSCTSRKYNLQTFIPDTKLFSFIHDLSSPLSMRRFHKTASSAPVPSSIITSAYVTRKSIYGPFPSRDVCSGSVILGSNAHVTTEFLTKISVQARAFRPRYKLRTSSMKVKKSLSLSQFGR
jgi:hypothetical protein